MDKRTPSSLSAALAGATLAAVVMGLGSVGHAAETTPAPEKHGTIRLAPQKQAAPAPPATAATPQSSDADDPYRCHPSEDVACTIVRETIQGTVIVTLRPGAQSSAPAWTVISGAPPMAGPHPGGTVYVVPNVGPLFGTVAWPHQATLVPANGAPILE